MENQIQPNWYFVNGMWYNCETIIVDGKINRYVNGILQEQKGITIKK